MADYEAPRIHLVANVYSARECAWLIKTAEAEGNFVVGLVSNLGDIAANPNPARVVDVKSLEKDSKQYAWAYDRLLKVLVQANKHLWKYRIPENFKSELVSSLQFYRYAGNVSANYNWHSDLGVKGETAKRVLSVTVQLTDPATYSGGVFSIQASQKTTELPVDQGQAFVFPSYVLHRVAPVTQGVRYSIVMWVSTD